MMRFSRYLLAGCLVQSAHIQPSQAFLDGLLKRGEEKKVLSAEELTSQEGRAEAALAKARSTKQGGKNRQARDAYKSIS